MEQPRVLAALGIRTWTLCSVIRYLVESTCKYDKLNAGLWM